MEIKSKDKKFNLKVNNDNLTIFVIIFTFRTI